MGYIFDPEELHEIANRAIGLPHREMCEQLASDLQARYPKHINPSADWVHNFAAGAKGMIKILHGSLTEYVLIFGTPIGTEGFSGRYRMDVWDFMIEGEMWTYFDDDIATKVVSKPGDATLLSRNRTKGYKLPVGSWMLEYARGLIPTAIPLGLGDAVFSCQDPVTVFKTMGIYGKQVTRNLLQGKI